jgi:hypothetical protein
MRLRPNGCWLFMKREIVTAISDGCQRAAAAFA